MPLPNAARVVTQFLYGQDQTPTDLNTAGFGSTSSVRVIDIDTAAYFDPISGPGRFALASNSALVEAFFSGSSSGIVDEIQYWIVNNLHPNAQGWQAVDGSYRLSKVDLAMILGIDEYGIHVANRSVADGYDDYAERTFIWGGTRAKLADNVEFVIDAAGVRTIENMAIVNWGHDDFDWDGSDWITEAGENALQHAIDPSGIGTRVELRFTTYEPEGSDYRIEDYQADLVKESSWTEPSLSDLVAAMQEVTDSLWSDGVTQFLAGDKSIIYGSIDDEAFSGAVTAEGYNVASSTHNLGLWGLDLHLHEYVSNGIIYQAGAGHDTISATQGDDVLYGGDDDDMLFGADGADVLIGGFGADSLFGGGADDFIFFDFADGENVNGGAGRDVAVALGEDGVTVDMATQGLECVIGCDGADTIRVSNENDPAFAAGGGGSDHFILDNLEAYGPRILWGGAGADVFEFQNGGRVSLAVVNIDGLTEEAFSRLTLEDLGLGEINVSWLSAIIINPDASDRFYSDDGILGTSSVNLRDWWDFGDDPDLLDLLLPGSAPVSLDVRTSDVLGGTYAIQGVFRNEVRALHEITLQYNYYDVTVRSDGGYDVVDTETYEEYLIRYNLETDSMIDTRSEVIEDALRSAERLFAQWDEYDYGDITSEYWTVQARSDIPTGPFYVVGGEFAGTVLSANDDLSGTLPDDPGPSPFDWLLAA